MSSAPRIAPLAERTSWARCWRSFPPSFKNEPRVTRLPGMAAESPSRSIPWPWSSAIAAGAKQPAETAPRCSRAFESGAGRRSTSRNSDVDPAEPAAQRQELLLPAAPRPQRRAVVEARLVRGSLQLPVQRRRSFEPFAEAARVAGREVRKAYLYANNHFSAKSVANAAILKTQLGQKLEGEYPAEFVEEYRI